MEQWAVEAQAKPQGEQVRVTWVNEIGQRKTQLCMAVFSNGQVYRLVSPELGKLDILKGNTSDILFEKIEKR